MYDPIHPAFYHFWSSGLVGLLGLASIYLISTRRSSAARDGSTNWMSSRRLYLLLLLAAWTHIPADVIEHGNGPRISNGIRQLAAFLHQLLF